jgi:nicotinamidase-related amidase
MQEINMHRNVLDINKSVLVVVDIQEKFVSAIHEADRVINNTTKLIQAANMLKIPVICTEQYPRGLGHTVDSLKEYLTEASFFEKTTFSCCHDDEILKYMNSLNKKQVIVTGIECHVCVNQTVHDLLYLDYIPHVIADAVSSRHPYNYEMGLQKMQNSGAVISTTEIALFECLKNAKNEKFKDIQKLIK